LDCVGVGIRGAQDHPPRIDPALTGHDKSSWIFAAQSKMTAAQPGNIRFRFTSTVIAIRTAHTENPLIQAHAMLASTIAIPPNNGRPAPHHLVASSKSGKLAPFATGSIAVPDSFDSYG